MKNFVKNFVCNFATIVAGWGRMNDYPSPVCQQEGLSQPDLREGLVIQRNRLTEQLNNLNAAITALDQNPEIARVLELVGKAGRH